MQKKYFFFDIDGTLTNDNPGGIILPSTLTTIRKLEENGILSPLQRDVHKAWPWNLRTRLELRILYMTVAMA